MTVELATRRRFLPTATAALARALSIPVIASGGVGGGVLMAIVGIIRNAMAKS